MCFLGPSDHCIACSADTYSSLEVRIVLQCHSGPRCRFVVGHHGASLIVCRTLFKDTLAAWCSRAATISLSHRRIDLRSSVPKGDREH